MEELCHENRIPPSALEQLRRSCDLLRRSLPSLGGVILHGSAATSGFEPGRTDLDVLAIVNANPDKNALTRVGEGILAISGDPHPLEFSIISRQALLDWQHPCPHLLHFGEEKRADYLAAILSDFQWVVNQDEDLSDCALSNACRTLGYLRDHVILSKAEGRQWCANHAIDTATLVAVVTEEIQRELGA